MTESKSPDPEFEIESLNLKLNECKVLYGLVAYPSRRDTEICQKLDMRKSTFSTIKNRLESQNIFRRLTLPGFPRINAELFAITIARMSLNSADTTGERLEVLKQVLDVFREDVYSIGESENLLIFSISQNFTNFDRNLQLLRQTGHTGILIKNMMNHHVLPFQNTQFIRFFSYAPLIYRLFKLGELDGDSKKLVPEIQDEDSILIEEVVDPYNFSSTEKKVFMGLLKNPDKSNRTLADEIGVSKNTLAGMKKKFLHEAVLLPRVMPDLLKIGIKLLILFSGEFEPETTLTDRHAGIEMLDDILKPIFLASKDIEFYVLYGVTSYEEYHALSTQMMIYFSEKNILAPNYNTVIFSLPHAKILKEHEYIPLVERLIP